MISLPREGSFVSRETDFSAVGGVRGGGTPSGAIGKFDSYQELVFGEMAVTNRTPSADAEPSVITRYIGANRDFTFYSQLQARNGDIHNLRLGNDFAPVAVFP